MDNIQLDDNNGASQVDIEGMETGNGQGQAFPTETHGLLNTQTNGANGERTSSSHQVKAQRTTNPQKCAVCRFKDQLNEKVWGKLRLWMIVFFIFIIITAVILISLGLCTVLYEDVDDKFDSSLFDVRRFFNGTFRIPNQEFTDELVGLSSNQSQELAAELQQKMTDVYRTSPALGRYFYTAEVHQFSTGSVLAGYRLTFVLPSDQMDVLTRFTVSRELVLNVFRQSLLDQDVSAPTYIEVGSLTMD